MAALSQYELRAIQFLAIGEFALQFQRQDDDERLIVRCTVTSDVGVTSFTADPDVFMAGLVRVREVSAVIGAFDACTRPRLTE